MSTFPPPPADLRRALVRQLKPYTRKATPTGAVLGSGTYGSVIELTSAGETVAGKVFRMSSTVRLQAIANRVCGELIMMTQLHHPNIVQCKGVSLLVDQPLPVLLMERLMSSLHAYLLHPDNSNLAVERKLSILRDTASGLDYLHSHTPAIIHRDLTAKNVLLDSELRTKIADFGNSRIMDLDPDSSPETLTSIPGTLEYMPPEAQGGRVTYDPSLDVFSFGHLSLFTIIQTPVRPLLPHNYPDSRGRLLGRSEVKRRVQFVEGAEQLLSENQSLVALIKQCLHNMPAQRPRTGELLTRLQKMMTPGEWIPPSPSLSPMFPSLLCAGGENSLSSTPADTHSPSHGRGPVGADSETDNSHTEKRNIFTGGDTGSAVVCSLVFSSSHSVLPTCVVVYLFFFKVYVLVLDISLSQVPHPLCQSYFASEYLSKSVLTTPHLGSSFSMT